MRIAVRIFAMMAQKAGNSHLAIEVPDNASLESFLSAFRQQHSEIPYPAGTMFAVNQEYATMQRLLKPGDEVAIIPPVSGG